MNGRSLVHYGIPRRSGRYKWGSGKNPYHHGRIDGKAIAKNTAKGTAKFISPIGASAVSKSVNGIPRKLSAEDKDRMTRRGDAHAILKNKEQFDDKELQRAANRLDLERKISAREFEQKHKHMKTVQDIAKSLDETTGSIERVSKRTIKLGRRVVLGV